MLIEDEDARQRAIDPNFSFIVQAPAGSGKTGLLTQRFLKLLSVVQEPEEIIAITFTRKAASEMHERIMHALKNVSSLVNSSHDYEIETGKLAEKALIQNKIQGWNLLQHSGRLKVQTIDSLCSDLSRQMPLLSQFGAIPNIIQDPTPLYLEAAASCLQELETDTIYSDAIKRLLKHLDNRLDKLQSLIAQMLAKREQWLRHIVNGDIGKETIEFAITQLIQEAIEDVDLFFPSDGFLGLEKQLIELINFAANNVDPESDLASCRDLTHFPSLSHHHNDSIEGLLLTLKQLNAITNWLMTSASSKSLTNSKRSWRKRLTKKEGFPAPSSTKDKDERALLSSKKEQMAELLSSLSDYQNNVSTDSSINLSTKTVKQNEVNEWVKALSYLSYIPEKLISDKEWQLLQSLFTILIRSVAHLTVVFSHHGEVDYSEISLSAKRALGDDENPTDLSLRLEHKIAHLLVDEFQDTSQNQFDLFKQLTTGWQSGDGHSLFIVGDPMQSIYRFREAEVGLFLKAWKYGLGDVQLEPLKLTVNFRSQAGIIEWVNESFTTIFPAYDEINKGAVCYSPSIAFQEKLPEQAVHYYPYLERQDEKEAEDIIEIIKNAKANDPESTIAILVRNRTHLKSLISRLQVNQKTDKQLNYQAVEIEHLGHLPMIQDLVMLTRAILNLDDRLAWLSIMRSPFIALELAELDLLSKEKTILLGLLNQDYRKQFSKENQLIAERVSTVFTTVIKQRDVLSLRQLVENCWLSLGGATAISTEKDKENARVYFDLLSNLESHQSMLNVDVLEKQVNKLYSQADLQSPSSHQIQLMTIHKSKGLEFDTVILPGLAKLPKSDDPQLLYWLETLNKQGENALLFSSINASDGQENKHSTYIKLFEQEKGFIESSRLLYVAATRAKKQLHLMWHYKYDEKKDEISTADKRSLIARLWPIVQELTEEHSEQINYSQTDNEQPDDEAKQEIDQTRQRLVRSWQIPEAINLALDKRLLVSKTTSLDDAETVASQDLLFDWASDTARIVGLVVHKLLENFDQESSFNLFSFDDKQLELKIKQLLDSYALVSDEEIIAIKQIKKALKHCVDDPKAQWILSTKHDLIENEMALTGVVNNKIRHIIVDRTFVDSDGIRWIIDYKTGSHQGGGLEEFLNHEKERYQQQLDNYEKIYSQLESRPIKKALYFPMIPAWIEC